MTRKVFGDIPSTMSKAPDERTRLAAVHLLSSRGGRDLARWVLSELKDGRVVDPLHLRGILVKIGEPVEVAAVCATAITLRASAAVLLEHIEGQRARVEAVTPVAAMVLGRLKRRERGL